MQKIDEAIDKANQMRDKFGGRWHVVVIDGELWEVHNSWFDKHNHHSEVLFSHAEEKEVSRKLSVVRRIIVKFNTFLLWLFKRLVNVKRDNSKA